MIFELFISAVFYEAYSSLEKSREACRQWSLLGLRVQMGQDSLVSTDSSGSKSRTINIVEGEKRMCKLNWSKRKVIGSYLIDEDGVTSEVVYKEFRF